MQNEAIIREYLLGRLDDHPELVERMDEQSLVDAEFSESVDLIEDEILEEYLEGMLNANDAWAVERHFLRPPERQQKLRNARLLSNHLATTSRNSEVKEHGLNVLRRTKPSPAIKPASHFRTYFEIAAAVLLAVCAVYLFRLRRELQIEVRHSGENLAQERQRTADLDQQLQAALDLAQPPTAMLTLLQPGLHRGEEQLPELNLGARTKNIHVEIALPSSAPGAYNVRLENGEKTIWSQDRIESLTAPSGAILILNVPAQGLSRGEARFVVRQNSGSETAYWFRVSRLQ